MKGCDMLKALIFSVQLLVEADCDGEIEEFANNWIHEAGCHQVDWDIQEDGPTFDELVESGFDPYDVRQSENNQAK